MYKKIAVMTAAGVVLSLFIPSEHMLSDMFFIISMVFFVSGLSKLIYNSGVFNSMVFGSKLIYRIFRKNIGASASLKDEYVEYTKSRVKYGDAGKMLLISLFWFVVSVLVSFF